MVEPRLQICSAHLALVRRLLREHVPDREVWVFGSRADGRARPTSDLDLAIMGDKPLPLRVLDDLQEAFAESDLPYRVDLVDWAATSESFRHLIARCHVVIQRPGDSGAYG